MCVYKVSFLVVVTPICADYVDYDDNTLVNITSILLSSQCNKKRITLAPLQSGHSEIMDTLIIRTHSGALGYL